MGARFFSVVFSFSVFLLGLADSCLANNSRLHSDEGSKLLMDKIVVLHNLENLACKFYPGLEQIQAWQRYACFWSELFPIFSSSSRCYVNPKKHKSLESWKKIFYFYFHQRYNMYCICKLQKKTLRNSMCWIQLLTNVNSLEQKCSQVSTVGSTICHGFLLTVKNIPK